MGTLDGKHAVVTGAAQGLGFGIAQTLQERGAHVTIWDLNPDALEAAKKELEGGNYSFDIVNVASKESVEAGAAKIEAAGHSVDILVNNAGISRDGLILKMEEDDWDTVIDVNLKSQYLCSKTFLNGMKDRNWGRIINISSRAWLGMRGQTNYSAAKAGVIGFTRSLALEFARFGVTVNCIAPGVFSTPLFRRVLTEERQEQLLQTVPMQRFGKEEDMGNAAAFFAEPAASYVTGQTIYVCGGRSLAGYSV